MTKKKRSYLFIISFLYFFLVFYVVFLLDYRLKEDFYGSINVIPFYKCYKFIFNYENSTISNKVSFLKEFFGNIILLFPFAKALEIVLRKKLTFKKKCFYIFITTFSIEFSQYIFNLGIMEVDDIILNFSGGVLGAYLLNSYNESIKV
jgi:glycopeptide antibiotics resistance protein